MSREIKFRGKRVDTGKWVFGYFVNDEEWAKSYIYNGTGFDGIYHGLKRYEVDPKTVGQFTGLKDRNGVEIYERDVITPCAYKKTTSEEWSKFKCEVIFYEGMFCLKPNGGLIQEHNPLYTSLWRGLKANNEYEVIGNSFENPELIKE